MHLAMIVNAWWMAQFEKPIKPKGKRKIKYPNIGADAVALGVDRIHLWKVLEGRRTSASLMKRYNALKSKQKGSE